MSEEPEEKKSGQKDTGKGEPAGSPPTPQGRGDAHRQPFVHPMAFAHRHALLVLWLSVVALMVMGCALWVAHYLESPALHERARQWAVARLEEVSGGRVELQRVGWSLHRLEFELSGLQIHGTETASEEPLLRVERVQAQLRWSDLLTGHLTLRSLQVVHPLVHVIVYKDGSTNIPERKPQPALPQGKPLLRLAVDEARLVDGRLDWNDQKIPLDGVATGVFVELVHDVDHYEGKARVGQAHMRTPQAEPLNMSADAQFSLYHDRVEVPRLRVNERGWVLEASGVVNNLASPVVQLSYRAAGDAAELAKLLRYRELRRGALQLSGQATYRYATGEYSAAGKAQASGVNWQSPTLRLEKFSGGLEYSVDRSAQGAEHLNIPSLFAAALGGSVHGTMETSRLPGKAPAGRMELAVTGLDLEQTLHAFSMHQLPLAGETVGELKVNWEGAPANSRMDAELQVRPLARAGRLPLTATIGAAVDFRHSSVELRQLDAHTPGSSLAAQGRLSEDSDLKLQVRTTELAELKPLVVAWRGSRALDLPIEFRGQAAFDGKVEGRLSSPTVAGQLELQDFTTVLRVPAKLATGAAAPAAGRTVRNHWDLLRGQVWYSANGEYLRNGLLQHGPTTVHVDAGVGLENGKYNASLPFSAHVKINNAQAEQVQRLLGVQYPVTGLVSAELRVSGTAEQMSGGGRIVMQDVTAWQQTVRLASADLVLTKNEGRQAGSLAQLRNIAVRSDAMQVTGDARFNLDSGEFGFALKGSEVRLEKLRALAARNVALAGVASFEASGQGTPAAPVINGRLSLRNLTYNGQKIGALNVEAVTHGAAMKLTARSNFRDAQLALDGEVELRGAMPMHMTGDLQSTKLNSLLAAYLPVRLEAPSEITMHFEASGEAKHPREITAQLEVDRLTASYGGIVVSNDGAIRLRMEHQVLRVEQFRLTGEGGSRFFRMRGEVELSGRREIDLHADGSLNLKLLETANPNLASGGSANLNLQVGGTLDRPSMHGRLNVQNGAFSYINFPNGLSDINGSLIFSEDRLQLQDLTARTGGGLLHCTGYLTYAPAQGLGFSLSASGHDIRMRYPQGLSSTADASLSLSGTRTNALLSGEVTVTQVRVNPRFNFATYVAKGVSGPPIQGIESPLSALHLDVRVISATELQVQSGLARLSGNLDLHLRGSAFRPVVLGRVNLLEGQVEFNGTKYTLERGDVTFTNPVRIAPTLDLAMSARVRDYDITLEFQGPIDKLTTTYRSDPPLSSSDIISLLALGVTQEEQANPAMLGSAQYQPSVSGTASAAVLGEALNATVSSRVQKLFGVSRVKINPNVGQALSAGLARVTVEQQISNKLTLTYISNLSQSQQQVVQGEYYLKKDVTVTGVRDQNGVVSFDVLFRKRIK